MAPKGRLACAYIGAARHEHILKSWCIVKGNFSLQLHVNSCGFSGWGRSMPRAEELCRGVDLMYMYLTESQDLKFSEVELCNGIINYNDALVAEHKFLPVVGKMVESKRMAQGILNAIGRFRDLKFRDKFLAATRQASEEHVRVISNFQSSLDATSIKQMKSPSHASASPSPSLDSPVRSVQDILLQLQDVSGPPDPVATSPARCVHDLLQELQDASSSYGPRCTSTQFCF